MEIILGIILLVGALSSGDSHKDNLQAASGSAEEALLAVAEAQSTDTPPRIQVVSWGMLEECSANRNGVIYRDLTMPYSERYAPKPNGAIRHE